MQSSLWLCLLIASFLCAGARPSQKSDEALKELISEESRQRFHKIANELEVVNPKSITRLRGEKTATTASITLVTPTLINNDDFVQVEYQNEKPSSGDWIGAYSPPDVDITRTVPIKYGFADTDSTYLKTGKGKLEFQMTNVRTGIRFYFFRNGLSTPQVLFTSDSVVQFENVDEPISPRVVPTGNRDVFNVLWSSANSKLPVLKWSTKKGGPYENVVSATAKTMKRSEMCGGTASDIGWFDLAQINTAELKGMQKLADSPIYYIFGDADKVNFSKEFTFFAPPLPGQQPPSRPTTAVLYCDMGRGSLDDTYTWNEYGRPAINTTKSVAARVQKGEVDVVFHGGDISYAVGYEAVWSFYLNMLTPVASGALYLTTVGNHESDWPGSPSYYQGTDSGGECGVSTTTLLPLPAPAKTNTPWYSYDVGLLHLIAMSSEHNFTIGSPQISWLEDDLSKIDRSKTPWVVLNLHRPMYINSNFITGNTSDLAVAELMQANIEPLIHKYKVNLAFYGHNHVVQRQSAVYQNQVVQLSTAETIDGEVVHMHRNPQATVHMVVGTAGAAFTKNAVTPGPAWSELVFYQYGYALLTAVNSSYLDWSWISSDTDLVVDRMAIVQDDPFAPFKA